MPTSPPSISALPTAPSTTSPATFDANADAFIAALPTFRTEANALASNAYGNAQDAYTGASNATAQVALAAAQVTLASNQVTLATAQATAADNAKVAAQAAATAAAIAAGAAIPSGNGQLYKTEGASNVKSTTFTAATGRDYDCDTTSAAFTATLPASPAIGDYCTFSDFGGTWDTNPLTLNRNGQLISASATDLICDIEFATVTVVFRGGTKGWRPQ